MNTSQIIKAMAGGPSPLQTAYAGFLSHVDSEESKCVELTAPGYGRVAFQLSWDYTQEIPVASNAAEIRFPEPSFVGWGVEGWAVWDGPGRDAHLLMFGALGTVLSPGDSFSIKPGKISTEDAS